MCDRIVSEVVDDSLAALKLVPNWFVTNKIIKKFHTAFYTEKNSEMGILNIDLDNINLDNNFDENNRVTIILIRRLRWHNKFQKRKELKKKISLELMPIA